MSKPNLLIMNKTFLLILPFLLLSITTTVAQTHTNYIIATGTNGYSMAAAITAPADDTHQPGSLGILEPVPAGWTITGVISIPGGDFIDFTEAEVSQIVYTYTGTNFSNPGTHTDINFFGFQATSNLGSIYSGHGDNVFHFEFATGLWEDNFNAGINLKGSGAEIYSHSGSKGVVDDLLILYSENPPPGLPVPLYPWMIIIPLLLCAVFALYRIRKKAIA